MYGINHNRTISSIHSFRMFLLLQQKTIQYFLDEDTFNIVACHVVSGLSGDLCPGLGLWL